MTGRRGFLGCALCAALGLVAERVAAQPAGRPAGGPVRTELRRIDYPDDHVSIQMLLEAPAGTAIPRHTHPGIESAYVLEGEILLEVQGRPDETLRQGDSFQVPAGVPHGGRVGGQPCKLHLTYIVEKGKPLASPA